MSHVLTASRDFPLLNQRRVRLQEAQEASEKRASAALLSVSRAVAREDRSGAWQAMVEAAAHYRNAGRPTLAAHWQARANALRPN